MAKITDLKLEQAQELLAYIGIEDADTFKETFTTKFFTKETALANDDIKRAIVGKRMQEIESKLLTLGKIVDPELSRSKLGEKQIEENIEYLATQFSTKLEELETRANTGNDKKVNDLQKMLEDKDKSISSYKELNERTAQEKQKAIEEKQNLEIEFGNKMKSYKVGHQFDQLKSKLNWVDDATDVHRVGFETIISSKYKFDLDEKENLIVLDKEGKPIQSKNKAAMADPFEILDFELEQNKLKKINNAKQNNVIFTPPIQQVQNGRQLPKDYLKRVGK